MLKMLLAEERIARIWTLERKESRGNLEGCPRKMMDRIKNLSGNLQSDTRGTPTFVPQKF